MLIAALMSLSGCAAAVAERTGPPVRVLSGAGPALEGPPVAALTLSGIDGLLPAANGAPCPAGGCFPVAAPAEASLLLAAPLDVPCNRVTSVEARVDPAASDRPAELRVTVHSRPVSCGVDPVAALPPTRGSLLAIPLSALPASELRVRLVHDGPSPRDLGLLADLTETVVDLRRPPAPGRPAATVSADAVAAITAARADLGSRVGAAAAPARLLMLGTTRWGDPSLGCGPGPSPSPPGSALEGFVITLVEGNHIHEYHYGQGRSVHCDSVELPGRHRDGTQGSLGGPPPGMGDGMPGM